MQNNEARKSIGVAAQKRPPQFIATIRGINFPKPTIPLSDEEGLELARAEAGIYFQNQRMCEGCRLVTKGDHKFGKKQVLRCSSFIDRNIILETFAILASSETLALDREKIDLLPVVDQDATFPCGLAMRSLLSSAVN